VSSVGPLISFAFYTLWALPLPEKELVSIRAQAWQLLEGDMSRYVDDIL
jgi:hypothetical protein